MMLWLLLQFPLLGGALPLVDPGLFVISGVQTCGNGTGYCLLGTDCRLNQDFEADPSGHCSGLRGAFTPSAHFVCCTTTQGGNELPASMPTSTARPAQPSNKPGNLSTARPTHKPGLPLASEPIQPGSVLDHPIPSLSFRPSDKPGRPATTQPEVSTHKTGLPLESEPFQPSSMLALPVPSQSFQPNDKPGRPSLSRPDPPYHKPGSPLISEPFQPGGMLGLPVPVQSFKPSDKLERPVISRPNLSTRKPELSLVSEPFSPSSPLSQSIPSISPLPSNGPGHLASYLTTSRPDQPTRTPGSPLISEPFQPDSMLGQSDARPSDKPERPPTTRPGIPIDNPELPIAEPFKPSSMLGQPDLGITMLPRDKPGIATSDYPRKPQPEQEPPQSISSSSQPWTADSMQIHPAPNGDTHSTGSSPDKPVADSLENHTTTKVDSGNSKTTISSTEETGTETLAVGHQTITSPPDYIQVDTGAGEEDAENSIDWEGVKNLTALAASSCPACDSQAAFFLEGSPLCLGSHLRHGWVLTSASCALRIFRSGMIKVVGKYLQDPVMVALVKTIAVHEDYRPYTSNVLHPEPNNIGLVLLSSEPQKSCSPCIPDKEDKFTGKLCSTPSNSTALSIKINNQEKVIGENVCESIVETMEGEGTEDDFYTAACDGGSDSRYHGEESGKGLLCQGYIAGIETSSGTGLAVFTPVSQFSDWVTTNMMQEQSQHFHTSTDF